VAAVIIRPQQEADDDAVRTLVTAAFADDGGVAELAEGLRARTDGGAALVADEGGEVVGHVQLSRSWVDAPTQVVDVLVLSPLSVRPDRQREGIGKALLKAAIEVATDAGAPVVFLEGDPAYYSRLGWERAATYGFTPPSVRIPDAAFQAVVLPAHRSWMTGALVYNDTFWSHDYVGLRRPT
jgi:putative acetyltransferase